LLEVVELRAAAVDVEEERELLALGLPRRDAHRLGALLEDLPSRLRDERLEVVVVADRVEVRVAPDVSEVEESLVERLLEPLERVLRVLLERVRAGDVVVRDRLL